VLTLAEHQPAALLHANWFTIRYASIDIYLDTNVVLTVIATQPAPAIAA
jgi:hypothetical protein